MPVVSALPTLITVITIPNISRLRLMSPGMQNHFLPALRTTALEQKQQMLERMRCVSFPSDTRNIGHWGFHRWALKSWLGPELNVSIRETPCTGKYQYFPFVSFLVKRTGTRWEDPTEMDSCDNLIYKFQQTLNLDRTMMAWITLTI